MPGVERQNEQGKEVTVILEGGVPGSPQPINAPDTAMATVSEPWTGSGLPGPGVGLRGTVLSGTAQ